MKINASRLLKIFAIIFPVLAITGCGNPNMNAHVKSSVFPEVKSTQPGTPFWVIIVLQMEKGWHTYYKDPGDSGMATKVEWKLPEGFRAGDLLWPEPKKFQDAAGVTFGYTNQTYLLTEITPPGNLIQGSKVRISAVVKWLACSDVCIPGKAEFFFSLPVTEDIPKSDSLKIKMFSEARMNHPLP